MKEKYVCEFPFHNIREFFLYRLKVEKLCIKRIPKQNQREMSEDVKLSIVFTTENPKKGSLASFSVQMSRLPQSNFLIKSSFIKCVLLGFEVAFTGEHGMHTKAKCCSLPHTLYTNPCQVLQILPPRRLWSASCTLHPHCSSSAPSPPSSRS